MKTKHLTNIMVFGLVTSNSDVMSPSIFPHGLKLNTEAYIKFLMELSNKTPRHTHKLENLVLTVKKNSVTTSHLTSGCLTPQITISLIIMYGTWLGERPRKYNATPKIN